GLGASATSACLTGWRCCRRRKTLTYITPVRWQTLGSITHEHRLVVVGDVPGGGEPEHHVVPVPVGAAGENPHAARRHHGSCVGSRRIARERAPFAALVVADVGQH